MFKFYYIFIERAIFDFYNDKHKSFKNENRYRSEEWENNYWL